MDNMKYTWVHMSAVFPQDHILDLTDELEVRRVRETEIHKVHAFEKQQIIEDIEGMRVGTNCVKPGCQLHYFATWRLVTDYLCENVVIL